MRLSTELAADEPAGGAVVAAALDAGVRIFDTARAYAPDEGALGHNERLVAAALRARGAEGVRVVTKCGMRRDGGGWVPDGRAGRLEEDAAASAAALGAPPDLLLLHAPDPRVPLATSARALARIRDAGLARTIGASNVTRRQLDELAAHAPLAAVEVSLGPWDHEAIRSGAVGWCLERGLELFAHAPLGGPGRVGRLARDRLLARLAARRAGVGAADLILAYLLALHPAIVPVVGARRPTTATRLGLAAGLVLDGDELAALDARFPWLATLRAGASRPRRPASARDAEVVLMMGIPGAGKSRAAEALAAGGHERLNRDALGGTLRGIARRLDERLREGATRLVLDNTYVTRATRSEVVRVAASHGARVRCLFFDTPLPEAQVNAVLRMLARFGRLPAPAELAALGRTDPAALAPNVLFRLARELEPPADDEGFSTIEVVPFAREHAGGRAPGVVVSFHPGAEAEIGRILGATPPSTPCLVYAWHPDPTADPRLAALVEAARAERRTVDVALCPHPPGPPLCWCRPPLPGLVLAFAHARAVDLRATPLHGESQADRTLARVLGMPFEELRVAAGAAGPDATAR